MIRTFLDRLYFVRGLRGGRVSGSIFGIMMFMSLDGNSG